MERPAIFLDCDGTLVEEVNYLHKTEEMRLFAGTGGALAALKEAGYLLVVVTNQSGIGRGIYTETDMNSIHEALQAQVGGIINGFYHCPHLPCDGCQCRKPGLKMIRDAQQALGIDVSRSWMVGDKKIDVETGHAAGMRTALVLTGYGESHQDKLEQAPHVIAPTFVNAVTEILRLGPTEIIV